MISNSSVLFVHNALIANYGGLMGIRDLSVLESAINRPYATFDGIDLYPTIQHKAAAIFQSILINHPFLDGNKRTAFAMMLYVLKAKPLVLKADDSETYLFVISSSKGEKNFDEILDWIKNNFK